MVGRVLTRLVAGLLLLVVFAEAAALTVTYFQTGWLFYANPHRVQRPMPAQAEQRALTGDALHPYFGPTHRPGLPFDIPEDLRPRAASQRPVTPARTNNFGFVSTTDYPIPRSTDRQFFVGIFGGSVALWFCQVGADRLFDQLRTSPALTGREIVPVCLAHEGYKQPQQLLVLSYFLSLGQPFDLVINIDGFNEVALGALNDQRGYDVSMPSVQHLAPMVDLIDASTLTPEKAEALGDISRLRRRLAVWARRSNEARSAAVHFVSDRVYAILDKQYRDAATRFGALPSAAGATSIVRITPKTEARSGDALYAAVARQWADASATMQDLLAARGVPYFHVLQPNQYASGRSFPEAERAIAFIDASPFKPGARQGYPHLLSDASLKTLRDRHVRFVDATKAFDGTAGQVYWDNCCHYTRLGNDVLADVIAGAVLAPDVHWR
ncbi:MAG: hypothetical protein Q7J25_04355 [Vicinamibacterales bacterium]|nr:hypothetical protein [Vicinamibacterales bacterium]